MDRLSSLPDEICRQIASSLLMHLGVKLTVLSKRWSLVFSSVRRMIFSYDDFPDVENKPLQFAEFIDRMISRHDDSNIEEFELLFNIPIEASVLLNNAWIEFALSRNVKHLILFLRIPGNQTFPDCFFSCKSLESLCLGVLDRFLKFPPSIHLPNLKALRLFRIFLSEGDSIKHLISSCPALQNLLIERSMLTHLSAWVISSVSLVNLTIQNCSLVSLNILVKTIRDHVLGLRRASSRVEIAFSETS